MNLMDQETDASNNGGVTATISNNDYKCHKLNNNEW